MNEHAGKISPAFEPFLAHSEPNEKRDAIVVYQAPLQAPRVRGRFRELRKRLKEVESRAAAQRVVQQQLFDGYNKASIKERPTRQRLEVASIGESAVRGDLWG